MSVIFMSGFMLVHKPSLALPDTGRKFHSLNIKDDISPRIFSVEKDKDGFMWFSTADAVYRYDGYRIKAYQIEFSQRTSLVRDHENNIYVFSSNGACMRYNKETDHFEELFNTGQDKNTRFIRTVFDHHNRVWSSSRSGLYCYDIDEGKCYKPREFEQYEISEIKLHGDSLFVYAKGILRILDLLQYRPDAPLPIVHCFDFPNEEVVHSSYFDSETGIFFLGTFNRGVLIMSPTLNSMRNILSLRGVPIRDIMLYDRNTIIAGTDGLGIFEIDRYSHNVIGINRQKEDEEGSLSSNCIYDLMLDDSRRLWIATYTGGVNLYDPEAMWFSYIAHHHENLNSLANNHVNIIFEDRSGRLWFGTNDGISTQNPKTGEWRHFLKRTNENKVILTFCENVDGTIWAGGWGVGLIKIDPVTFNITELNADNSPLTTNSIFSLFRDTGNYIWIDNGSLLRYNPRTSEYVRYPLEYITQIIAEDVNRVLVLSAKKIYSINIHTGSISQDIQSLISESALAVPDDYITCLFRQNNTLWIGTNQSGLIKYSYDANSCTIYDQESWLISGRIQSIAGENDDLWISSDKGLIYMNTRSERIIPLRTGTGIGKGNFTFLSSLRHSDGRFMFGTTAGALVFNSVRLEHHELGLPMITDITTADGSVLIPAQWDDRTKGLRFAHNDNHLTFRFCKVSYNPNQRIYYRWRLAGYDDLWSEPSEEGIAQIRNIPVGKYQFQIRVLNQEDDNGFVKNLDIYILKPWWNRAWAWVAYGLLAFAIIHLMIRYHSSLIESRNSREKVQFFINASHDMRTPITLIKSPLSALQSELDMPAETRVRLLQIMNNNVNRLSDMTNKLLEYEQYDNVTPKVVLKKHALNNYLYEIRETFSSYAESADITIELIPLEKDIIVLIDREHIDKILDNLITNAIKYSHHEGKVSIIPGWDHSGWWIEIRDRGIGIPKSDQKKLFCRFYRAENAINMQRTGSGIGLMLVGNLIELHGGEISINSKEGVYTNVKIFFPPSFICQQEHTAVPIDSDSILTVIEHNEDAVQTIVIVEDNKDMRDYLEECFRSEYNIMSFASAQEAMKGMGGTNVDMILTDIMMPEIDGFEFCSRIKSNATTAHIPVILVSALSRNDDILRGLRIGADDYVTKPFDFPILRQRIGNILANKRKLLEWFRNHLDSMEPVNQDYFNEIDRLFFEKTGKIVMANISNPEFSIDSLCREIGMSRSVFYNRLKNLTNLTPSEFIRNSRMEYAARLIREKRYPVATIAMMTGFSDPKYFSTAFNKHFGYPPSKFV